MKEELIMLAILMVVTLMMIAMSFM